MSLYRRIMDSKAMDILEIVGDCTVEFIKFTVEVIHDTFNHSYGSPQPQFGNGDNGSLFGIHNDDVEQETYEYWKKLSYTDQQFYFDNNETLKHYGESYRYQDREQMAKSAAYIAKCTGYAFTNKYDRY